jgi:hypothetical protein
MQLIEPAILVNYTDFPSGNAEVLITQQAQRVRDGKTPALAAAGNKQAAFALYTLGDAAPFVVQIIEEAEGVILSKLDTAVATAEDAGDTNLADAYRAQL